MNGDVLYAILMSVGWLFLAGWMALLLIACGLAFGSEGWKPSSVEPAFLTPNARRVADEINGTRQRFHLRA